MFDYVRNALNPTPALVLGGTARPPGLVADLPYCSAVVMDVPGSADELRSLHKSKFWSTLRRKERRLGEAHGDVRFEALTAERDLRAWLPRVQALFAERWADEYTSLPWKTAEGFGAYADALVALAATGAAELLVLHAGGRLLAFAYCLVGSDTYFFYQHAATTQDRYRRFSPGKLLVWKMVTRVVDDGRFRTLDFMLGEHDYKQEWGTRAQQVHLRVAEPRTPAGAVRFVARWLYHRARIHVQFRNERLRTLAKALLRTWFGAVRGGRGQRVDVPA